MIKTITLIGVGLIGGSVAQALKQKKVCQTLIGYDTSISTLEKAVSLNIIDRAATSIADATAHADLVIIAVPVGAFANVCKALAKHLRPNTIITDVSSCKRSIVVEAKRFLGTHFENFVPGHPIAGSELAGVAASDAALFEQRQVIVTPEPETQPNAIAVVSRLWQQLGANVTQLSAAEHDDILALTSHLPHVLAFAFMENIAKHQDCASILQYSGDGFRDFTRIAAANPTLWADICIANGQSILKELNNFHSALATLQTAIQNQDHQQLTQFIEGANKTRHIYGDKHEQ